MVETINTILFQFLWTIYTLISGPRPLPPPLISDEDFAFFWGHIDIFYQMLNYNKYCLFFGVSVVVVVVVVGIALIEGVANVGSIPIKS